MTKQGGKDLGRAPLGSERTQREGGNSAQKSTEELSKSHTPQSCPRWAGRGNMLAYKGATEAAKKE